MNETRRRRWVVAALTAAVLLGVALRLAVFVTSVRHIPAFDDECKIALQAKQIARGDCSLLILASPYIFPLDAYLMAPLIHVLPRNAFGVRVLAFGAGLLSLAFSLLILRRWGRWRDTWPGMALVLFGSTYLLSLQYGCAMPGYYTLLLLASVTVWLAERQADDTQCPWVSALVAGAAGGLACSETMLSLPVLAATGAMLGLHRGWRTARIALPALVLGALLGLLPHLVATCLHPDAFGAVERSVSWKHAWNKLYSPSLDHTLPAALGLAPPVFPDTEARVGRFGAQGLWFSLAWSVVLLGSTALALSRGVRRWRQDRWPSLDVGLVFVGISWMCLLLFLFSGRSHLHTYRYFAPLVWSFPFLVGYLYRDANRPVRWALGGLTAAFLAANAVNDVALLSRWSAPGFADDLKSYDLQPALRYLDERGINRGYATYVDAYRFTFETDERIIVCQPFNERFPGWLVPFRQQVDPVTNAAYILSDTYKFTPELLAADLHRMNIGCHSQTCGHYTVFTDFTGPQWTVGKLVPRSELTARASHNPTQAGAMLDGDLTSFWRCNGSLQLKGMWVTVTWDSPRRVQRLRLDHGNMGRDHDHAEQVNVYAKVDGAWAAVARGVPDAPVPFEFRNGHPVYGRAITDITLPEPVQATGLKVEIAEPRSSRAWTIYEFDVIEAD